MSKSLARVRAALAEARLDSAIRESPVLTRTAQEAASSLECDVDQIGKSIVFVGCVSGETVLFLTAGGHRVDPGRAERLAGEPLRMADAAAIRDRTGFAIGGVAPLGHLTPPRTFVDCRLTAFTVIWCAAGTPRHNFAVAPGDLVRLTGGTVAAFSGTQCEIPSH